MRILKIAMSFILLVFFLALFVGTAHSETVVVPLVGRVCYTPNIALFDLVRNYLIGLGWTEFNAAQQAAFSMQEDGTNRLETALRELRQRDPAVFDATFARYGLQFQEVR